MEHPRTLGRRPRSGPQRSDPGSVGDMAHSCALEEITLPNSIGEEEKPDAMDNALTSAPPHAYLMDMDGVLVRGAQLIPGADGFIERRRARGLPFLVLTNNSLYTPRDLQLRLERIGSRVRAEEIFTSALATAQFL